MKFKRKGRSDHVTALNFGVISGIIGMSVYIVLFGLPF